MAIQEFNNVWYRENGKRWRDLSLLAFQDVGTLKLQRDSIIFTGKHKNFQITDIRHISCEKQGRDFINNWVKVDFNNDKVAFFSDGGLLGWRGLFGGTRRILLAITKAYGV